MTPINKLMATVLLLVVAILPASGQQTAEEWFNQGKVLWEQGNYDEAIKCFDEAFRLGDPPNTEVLLLALVIMPASGQQIAEAWNNKGVALKLKAQGKYDEALEAFDEAIRINPQFAEAWYNKGLALDNLGKHDEAIQAYDEAIKINPQDAAAWSNKGNALKQLNRTTEADAAYAKARKLGFTG